MSARKRPFSGLLLKPIDLAAAPARGLRLSFAEPPNQNDIAAYILEQLDARYVALDNFFGVKSKSENIWDLRADALLAYIFGIPDRALQSSESLTRYLTGRHVPGFKLKGPSEKARGAPLEWDFNQSAQLFADIEFLRKNTGKSVYQTCKDLPTKPGYARRWGRYKPEGLRKAYRNANKLRRDDFRFALHLSGPTAPIPAKRPNIIELAIERHALKRP